MKRLWTIAAAALLAASAQAQDTLDYQRVADYNRNADPSVVILGDGSRLSVVYDGIPWEDVENWPAGKQITIGYKAGEGTFLIDPVTHKRMLIIDGVTPHPIDAMLQACIDKDGTTVGMMECHGTARTQWEQEIEASLARLSRGLTPDEQTVLKEGQVAWSHHREKHQAVMFSIYQRGGTMHKVMAAQASMELSKVRAMQLSTLIADASWLLDEAPPEASQASFDCAKATTAVEKLICSVDALGQQDLELASAYKAVRDAADDTSRQTLQQQQVAFLKERHLKCKTEVCVKEMTAVRLAELRAQMR